MAAGRLFLAAAGWRPAQELTRELRVPVIDGVSAAVKMVESLVALGWRPASMGT